MKDANSAWICVSCCFGTNCNLKCSLYWNRVFPECTWWSEWWQWQTGLNVSIYLRAHPDVLKTNTCALHDKFLLCGRGLRTAHFLNMLYLKQKNKSDTSRHFYGVFHFLLISFALFSPQELPATFGKSLLCQGNSHQTLLQLASVNILLVC